MLPTIALVCNVIVVSGGVWRFSRTGDLSLRRPMPFLAASVPAAWIGGRIPVSETVFIGLLGGALLLSVSHLAFQKGAETATVEPVAQSRNHRLFASGIGGAIGLLSGIVGIGGGIFLAPVLYLVRWGRPRQIAAASTVRRQNIWRNSGLRA